VFPFGTAPPPYFMRNFMQAVAGHMVHGGITTTTISTRNPPANTAGAPQQGIPATMDSGTTNAGQSTQARYMIIITMINIFFFYKKFFYAIYFHISYFHTVI